MTMSGINGTLSIAKGALTSYQVGLNIAGHNISNVNTEGYSRQTVVFNANRSVLGDSGNFIGNGVSIEEIQRSCDQLLENRLMDQNSNLAAYEAGDYYMKIMEGVFNENSDSGMSGMLSQFWNSWQDLSNNPAGVAERIALFENGTFVAEEMNLIDSQLEQLKRDLTSNLESSIQNINDLAKQIATLNNEIQCAEAVAEANDQRDMRNALISQLAELVDVQCFEQPDGNMIISTARGYSLVNGSDTYELGLSSGRITWEASYGGSIDITDKISGGKIGGWLQMRDEIVPKYQSEFDALAQEFIWAVNYQHSQGVGLEFFSGTLTGTYAVDSSGMLGTLPFGDRIDYSKDFKMWIDGGGGVVEALEIDMGISDATVSNWTGTAAVPASFLYEVTVIQAGSVSADATADPVLQWEKKDSAGNVLDSGSITVTDVGTYSMDGLSFDIGAGELVAGNTFSVRTDDSGVPNPVQAAVSGTANSVLDTYTLKVISGKGDVGADTIRIEWTNQITSGVITLEAGSTTAEIDGMELTLNSGTVRDGDTLILTTDSSGNAALGGMYDWHWTLDSFSEEFNRQTTVMGVGLTATAAPSGVLSLTPQSGVTYAFSDNQSEDCGLAAALGINTFFDGYDAMTICMNSAVEEHGNIAVATIDAETGTFGTGDNSNALAISDVQFASLDFAQWTFRREGDDSSKVSVTTLEGFYQGMIGSMGLTSAGLSRGVEFSEALVNKIQEQRDSLSAVSLDEELISMMKFQQAYSAAAKLLTVADEMLQSLLNAR